MDGTDVKKNVKKQTSHGRGDVPQGPLNDPRPLQISDTCYFCVDSRPTASTSIGLDQIRDILVLPAYF